MASVLRTAALPLALAIFGVLEAVGVELGSTVRGPAWVNALYVVAMAAALLWRRTRPLATLVGTTVIWVAWENTYYRGHEGIFTAWLIQLVACFSAGQGLERRSLWQPLAVMAAMFLTADLPSLLAGGNPGDVYPAYAFMIAALALGQGLRRARLQAEAERERWEADAAADERGRIARELHDVVTHNVSGIVVHASAERRNGHGGPAETLELIERTGRDTLVELRRLLGVLRSSEGESLEPQPSLALLPDLLDEVRRAGTEVSLDASDDLSTVPAGIQLQAFRIVQEALTNVRRHAPGASASVALLRAGDELRIEIVDDGSSAVVAAPGHGLIGMRERVALHQQVFEAGPTADGSFRVAARFPLA